MLVEILVALLTLVAMVTIFSFYHYVTAPANLPPGPTPLPVLGNYHNIVGADITVHCKRLAKIYGDIFTLRLAGGRNTIFVNSLGIVKEALLGKNRNVFAGRLHTFTSGYISRGNKNILFCDFSPSLTWRRKIVHSGLRMYFPRLEEKVIQETHKLEARFKTARNTPINSTEDFSLLMLNIIFSILCGKAYESSDPEFPKIVEFGVKLAKLPAFTILDVFPWLIHFPLDSARLFKRVVAIRDEVLDKVLQEHQETFREGNIRDLTDAFIAAKLEAEREDKASIGEVTNDHLVMMMSDVFGGGLETTTSTLRWSVAYFMHYPKVQARTQAEIDDVIGDRWPALSDREDLPYMEALVAEIQRITSVAAFSVHKATSDSTLAGFSVPKDTAVIINLWAIHHDAREWPNPDVFNPLRFINAEGKFEVPPNAGFYPFSMGRRVCPGESLAKSELFLTLTRLLQQFTFECPPDASMPDLKGEVAFTRFPKPFQFCAKPREHDN